MHIRGLNVPVLYGARLDQKLGATDAALVGAIAGTMSDRSL